MKEDGKTTTMMNIAGRDVGTDTLACYECGRYWGQDDIYPPEPEDGPSLLGRCPICNGAVFKR